MMQNKLVGIKNIGNTCYMNATLQCLFHTKLFTRYICSAKFKDELYVNIYQNLLKQNNYKKINIHPDKIHNIAKNTIVYSIKQIFVDMLTSTTRIVPTYFKSTIGKKKNEFSSYNQQDSMELIDLILDQIHEELKSEYYHIDLNFDNKYWNTYILTNKSIITELFTGMFCSRIHCKECDSYFDTFTIFNVLNLPIGKCTDLQTCINSFLQVEILDSLNRYDCERCKKLTMADQQTIIAKTPKILIIQLKRFSILSKINTHIDIPADLLQINSDKYKLYGIIQHSGSLFGGHYYADVRLSNGDWYRMNDEYVNKMNEQDIVSSTNYILFYEKY